MKMIDPKDFILSPEDLTAMKESPPKSPSAHKQKRGIQFYKFPKEVVDVLVRANYAPAWTLTAAIFKGCYDDFKHRNPVKLTSALLKDFRISKKQKYKALKLLEQSGQFLVERRLRHNPLVMMKWIPPKDCPIGAAGITGFAWTTVLSGGGATRCSGATETAGSPSPRMVASNSPTGTFFPGSTRIWSTTPS
jgi:hypothetical protein